MLKIYTRGPLRIIDINGIDRTPVGQKAQGLIALLSLSPNNTRSRTWLQDKLWSDRGQNQASSSLRQALHEARSAFGPYRAALRNIGNSISLDKSTVEIIFDNDIKGAYSSGELELFDGLNIKDREFENWIRDKRSESNRSARIVAPSIHHSKIIIHVNCTDTDEPISVISRHIAINVLNTLRHNDNIQILLKTTNEEIDFRNEINNRDIVLDIQTTLRAGLVHIAPVIKTSIGSSILWSTSFLAEWPHFALMRSETLYTLVADIVYNLEKFAIHKQNGNNDTDIASRLFKSAQMRTFRLTKNDLSLADEDCDRAIGLVQLGEYSAWKAFIRSVAHFQFGTDTFLMKRDSIEELMRQALSSGQESSLTFSIAANIEYLFGDSQRAARQLARAAIELDPTNFMAWATQSNIQTALGNADEGIAAASMAEKLSAGIGGRAFFTFYKCMAYVAAGDYARATDEAHIARILSPHYIAPRRYLVALHATAGDRVATEQASIDLRCFEPSFMVKTLLDQKYPVKTMHKLPIIEKVYDYVTTDAR